MHIAHRLFSLHEFIRRVVIEPHETKGSLMTRKPMHLLKKVGKELIFDPNGYLNKHQLMDL